MADAPRSFESPPQGCQEIEGFSEEEVQHFKCLPDEIKKHIASLLPPKDAFALSRTCRIVFADLSLTFLDLPSVWPRRQCWYCHHGDLTGDTPKRGPKLPTALLFSPAHSVTLKCTYSDQGWGNRKGRLYIVGHRRRSSGSSEDEYACDPNDISQGRIVAQSPVADHNNQALLLSFCPREDEAYNIWYTVGGGGGHQLYVSDARQVVVVYDNPSRGTRNAFRYLYPLFYSFHTDEGAFARTYSAATQAVEFLLPILTATLQSLTMMKEACNNGDFSVAMLETTHEPILAHLREHDLDVMNDDVLHTLRNMIPRAQIVASIIHRNFADYAIRNDDDDDDDDDEDAHQFVGFMHAARYAGLFENILPQAVPVEAVPVERVTGHVARDFLAEDDRGGRVRRFGRRLSRMFRRSR